MLAGSGHSDLSDVPYLMESDEEALRLDLKTDAETVQNQSSWAGLTPGMRVADLGCGAGKTTYYLNKCTQPDGHAVGLDMAGQRIRYAEKHYSDPNITYIIRDMREPLEDLGSFDFIWVRFVLEYYGSGSFDIIKHISNILKPGGILCLIDLDCNCLRHFGFPPRLEGAISGIMASLQKNYDFDPYAGIKFYSYFYDLGFEEIDVSVHAHNLIFGEVEKKDIFNMVKKLELGAKKSGYNFEEYEGGYEEFAEELKACFTYPRRFTYTPLIACRGRKPT